MSEATSIETAVVNATGTEVGKVALPEVFSERVHDWVLFDQVLAQLASRRSGTAATKTRGLISGGGKKPWRQKGTGRARAGSSRSPVWRGGGTIFGPQPRSYAYRLPRSARKKALGSALAQKLRDGEMIVIESLAFDAPRTKQMRTVLEGLGIRESVLVVLADRDDNTELSARNLPGVTVLPVEGLNVYDILRHRRLLVTRDAVAGIEERVSR
jgi:large subunit ribosomal protein L4